MRLKLLAILTIIVLYVPVTFAANSHISGYKCDRSSKTNELYATYNVIYEGKQETVFILTMEEMEKIREYEKKLIWFASHDGLTKVYNRSYFDARINKEWLQLSRKQEKLSIIMLDIDYFKKFNDSLGHQQGDYCLQLIAECIQESIQNSGSLVARYGGEEFVVVLPNVDETGVKLIANKILANIRDLKIEHPSSDCDKFVTVSVGTATIQPEHDLKVETLINKADNCLYQAKKQGRNQVCQ